MKNSQNKKTNDDIILRKQEIIANTLFDIEYNVKNVDVFVKENEELLQQILDHNSVSSKKTKL